MTYVDPRQFPCPACGERVEYAAGRRRCIDCKVWVHEACAVDAARPDGRVYCEGCARRHAPEIVKRMAMAINGSREPCPSLEMVVWSLVFDQDEKAMASELGIPSDEVRRVAQVFLDDGTWKDGKLCLSFSEDADGGEMAISMMLASLVADGMVVRTRVGADGEPVEDGGGDT